MQSRTGLFRLYKGDNMRDYIEAREGYILTDGKTYGTIIYLAEGVDKTAFKEITEEEYNEAFCKMVEDIKKEHFIERLNDLY